MPEMRMVDDMSKKGRLGVGASDGGATRSDRIAEGGEPARLSRRGFLAAIAACALAAPVAVLGLTGCDGGGVVETTGVGGLTWGTYYTQVDNTHATHVDDSDTGWHYESLPAANAEGERQNVTFMAGKELAEGAWLKLDLQVVRGVVSWEKVEEDEVPAAARAALG